MDPSGRGSSGQGSKGRPGKEGTLETALLDPRCAVGARFATVLAEARAAWPALRMEGARFAGRVAEVLEEDQERDADRALGQLCVTDLYLAQGCLAGDAAALAGFESLHVRPLRTFVREIDGSPTRLEECKQALREKLLVGSLDGPPRIGSYAGRGELRIWVRVAAQRLALSGLRRGRPAASAEASALEEAVAGPDPEVEYLRAHFGEAFGQAVSGAVRELEPRLRLVLRLNLVDGVSLTAIAGIYRVSQSTVSRWVAEARESIAARTKQTLQQRTGLSSSDFASLARLVQSGLDLSLASALAAG